MSIPPRGPDRRSCWSVLVRRRRGTDRTPVPGACASGWKSFGPGGDCAILRTGSGRGTRRGRRSDTPSPARGIRPRHSRDGSCGARAATPCHASLTGKRSSANARAQRSCASGDEDRQRNSNGSDAEPASSARAHRGWLVRPPGSTSRTSPFSRAGGAPGRRSRSGSSR